MGNATRPLLMIPGPIELSPNVVEAFSKPSPGHLAPGLIESFGRCLEMMRDVWQASAEAQPFVIAGGGTVAMDMVAANLVEPGETAVVVNTGYFSDRLAEMLRRQGAKVVEVAAPAVGDAPGTDVVGRALAAGSVKALFATHVDTSTGVRIDAEPLARMAHDRGILSVFDGVCATAGESFRMKEWGADVYLTGSQKALGVPPGLALLVASPRALEARARRGSDVPTPPMYLDLEQWLPIMKAYEDRKPAYFSTPATNLILALEAGLGEILEDGIEDRVAKHRRAARAMRSAWDALGLSPVPVRPELQAATLSAVYLPEGIDSAAVVGGTARNGVVVAGGLHPEIRTRYFRVGHMGYAITRKEMLLRTVEAIGTALRDAGASADPARAVSATESALR
jgi:alanine-glyoxylate transaminase/serine-glyoxylate transaminase/serine-pyruvate transaminase